MFYPLEDRSTYVADDVILTYEDIVPLTNTVTEFVCEILNLSKDLPEKLAMFGIVCYFFVPQKEVDIAAHSLSQKLFNPPK